MKISHNTHKIRNIMLLISPAVIVASIILWIFLAMGNNFVINRESYPEVMEEFQGEAICTDTNSGWSCKFNESDSRDGNFSTWGPLGIPVYKNACEEMGGDWKCYGYCMPKYDHYCDFKFADAGEPCISSLQCG